HQSNKPSKVCRASFEYATSIEQTQQSMSRKLRICDINRTNPAKYAAQASNMRHQSNKPSKVCRASFEYATSIEQTQQSMPRKLRIRDTNQSNLAKYVAQASNMRHQSIKPSKVCRASFKYATLINQT